MFRFVGHAPGIAPPICWSGTVFCAAETFTQLPTAAVRPANRFEKKLASSLSAKIDCFTQKPHDTLIIWPNAFYALRSLEQLFPFDSYFAQLSHHSDDVNPLSELHDMLFSVFQRHTFCAAKPKSTTERPNRSRESLAHSQVRWCMCAVRFQPRQETGIAWWIGFWLRALYRTIVSIWCADKIDW